MDDNYVFSYQTSRPLLGGWSSMTRPLVDENKIYFCGGYGWWDDDIHLIALNKSGHKQWGKAILKPCGAFTANRDYLVLEQTYQTPKNKDEDQSVSSFNN